MSSRIAAARKTSAFAKGETRVPLGRISNSRVARQPMSARTGRENIEPPQTRRAPLEPFHHKEVPIGDPHDPQDVVEYEHVIYRSLRQKETAMRPLRFEQNEITLKDRNILVDALCRVHYKLSLATSTLYRCVGILDRYLSVAQVSKLKLNLIGNACMLAASKIEDIYPAQTRDLIQLADRGFTKRGLLAAECEVMNAIGFDATFATPLFYVTQFMRISGQTQETLLLARYITEICQTHEQFFGVPPALVASLAVLVTRTLRGQSRWSSDLADYTAFSEEHVGNYVGLIRSMLLETDREETRFMRRKYGSDLFHGVAHIRVPSTLV